MHDVIFIGNRRDARMFCNLGIESFCPSQGHLVERVMAERKRCRVLAMTAKTFAALPSAMARGLREGSCPRLQIVPSPADATARAMRIPRELRALAARTLPELQP